MRALFLALLLLAPTWAAALSIDVPDERLLDQDGREVSLREVLQGPVAVNFIFTTCSTICSPMTAIFAQLQRELGPGKARLVSISLDPATDTPERLDAYAKRFGRQEGWTFLTAKPSVTARVLRALAGHVGRKEEHTPVTLLGDGGRWKRVHGLVPPARLVAALEALRQPAPAASKDEASRSWFTDLEVIDQRGRKHRFYSDLVSDGKVLIHFAFTTCNGACTPIVQNLARVQKEVGDEVRILTISVDPVNDTPEKLRAYAARFGAAGDWYFLTGREENVETIRRRLGDPTEDPDAHPMTLYIGDVRTGNWIKAMATDPHDRIVDAIVHLNDAP